MSGNFAGKLREAVCLSKRPKQHRYILAVQRERFLITGGCWRIWISTVPPGILPAAVRFWAMWKRTVPPEIFIWNLSDSRKAILIMK